MIKINGKKYETKEVIKIEINDKIYTLPLMKHLKYKDIKKLINMKDDADLEMILGVLSSYIPMEVLEELSVADIVEIMNAWKDVNGDGLDLGN